MTIEHIKKQDLPGVLEVAKERELSHSLNEAVLVRALTEDGYTCLSLKADKDIHGYILAMLEGEEAEIDSVAVIKNDEGKGYGTLLVKSMLDYLKSKKVKRVLLEVKETNAGARHLYEKFGFVAYRIRKGYYDGVDAICMDWRDTK